MSLKQREAISIRWKTLVLLSSAISGCQVGPQYQYPEISIAGSWKNEEPTAPDLPAANWWEVFQDEKLASLIEQAVCNNPSLFAASQKVEEARELAKAAKSRLFPQINFDPAASSSVQRVHSIGMTQTPPPSLIQNHIDQYILPLTLLYEFDFWGKLRGQYKTSQFLAESELEAYRTALLLLTTDLANAYFQLRIQDAQIESLKKILATRKAALEIQRSRFEAKLADYVEVASYQTDYSTVEAAYYDASKQRDLFENQIAVLVGASPSGFKLESMPLTESPPMLPAGLPAQVLLRRPDLAEQERKMAAIHAEINVAYASYFPKIDLTGVLNFLSNDFLKTENFFWSIGGNFIEVLFDAGARGANIKAAKAKFETAAATYKEKVLTAFQEVEDSLASLNWLRREMQAVDTAVAASSTTVQIALDRYQFGLASYLEAANYTRTELDQEINRLKILSQNYLHTIHLIKAIGGGWE